MPKMEFCSAERHNLARRTDELYVVTLATYSVPNVYVKKSLSERTVRIYDGIRTSPDEGRPLARTVEGGDSLFLNLGGPPEEGGNSPAI